MGDRPALGRDQAARTPARMSFDSAGSVNIEYTLARLGAERLYKSLQNEPYVAALGTLTGGQAVQAREGRFERRSTCPAGRSPPTGTSRRRRIPIKVCIPANSAPALVKRLNNALQRADQIQQSEGKEDLNYYLPIVADAEAGLRRSAELPRDHEELHRGRRRGRALRRPARGGEEVRPPRR